MDTLERLLSAQDLADYLGVPVATIYTWRHRGHGPPGFRAGRHLRFRTSDVTQWITQHIDHKKPKSARLTSQSTGSVTPRRPPAA